MKKRKNNFIIVAVLVVSFISAFTNDRGRVPFLVNVEKIRVTQASDLDVLPATTADMLVIIDRASVITNGALPFPASPIDGQTLFLTTRNAVTNVTLNTNGKNIYGSRSTLSAGEVCGWVYDVVADSWFAYHSDPTLARWGNITGTWTDQTDLQTELNSKLSSTSDGSALTGLTKTQVGLSNVDNTSDANKPVSSATQTALNLKQNIAGNTGGWTEAVVSGSNATTTGQVLTDITGLVSGTLSNSTKYEIEAILDVGTSAVTTGTQYGVLTGGTGGAGVVSVLLTGTTTTNATTTTTLSSSGSAAGTFLTTSGTSGTVLMRGFVTTRGSGTATISIQHLKGTSGTSTVRTGSKFRYRLAQ